MAIVFILGGCQSYLVRTFVDVSSIPDQEYLITIYNGPMAESYAVLFDIPDDSTEMFMRHTSFTEKIGVDSSRDYIDEFHARTRSHRTLRIGDQDGTVKGYLIVSNLLNYLIRPADEGIMVSIEDPYHGYLQSAP